MADKNWLQKIFTRDDRAPEVKQLEARYENQLGELKDILDSEVKFMDAEPSSFNSSGQADYSSIDQQIDAHALLKLYCTETWVSVAINAIAKTVAGLPIKTEKKSIVRKKIRNRVTGTEEEVNQTVWADSSGDKIHARFEYPNPFTSKYEFLNFLMIDLLATGEAFIYLDSDEDLNSLAATTTSDDPAEAFNRLQTAMGADTKVKGLYRLPPPLMHPCPYEDKPGIEGYIMQSDKGSYAYGPGEIIHIKFPNPMNPYRGLSPLIATFKAVLLDRFSTEHMVRFYKSGMRLGGVVTSEKSMNKEQLSRFQRSLESNFTGRANHHRTLVLPAGMKYDPIDQNPAETSLIEFCKYNREAILAAYNVPPIKVGIMDNANYANALVQLKIFFEDTIKPLLTLVEDGFNLKQTLMPAGRVYRFKFDLNDVEALKETFKDKAEAAKFMMDGGLSVNEVREQVWNLPPVVDGDKVKVVEDIKNGKTNPAGIFGLSAPASAVDEKTALPNAQADTQALTDIEPTKGTFSDRVSQLVQQFMAAGVPIAIAIPKAIEQAKTEGFTDPDEPTDPNSGGPAPKPTPDAQADQPKDAPAAQVANPEIRPNMVAGEKPKDEDDKDKTLAEFISEALAKLDPNEPVDPDFIQELVAVYNEQHKTVVDAKESAMSTDRAQADVSETQLHSADKDRVYGGGHSKDTIIAHWKSFISKTEPFIEKRQREIVKFFKTFQTITMNRLGANLKSYGIHKSRDSDDADDILDPEAYDAAINEYIKEVDKALLEAYKYGYSDTMVEFGFKPNDADAKEFLKEYGAKEVKYITDTTRDQLKAVLLDAFDKNMAVGDISKALREKFTEMEQGRAVTIARTEALSAVSAGRDAKRETVQEQYPEKTFKKMWVSAQDDRVRDSHQELDGEVVEASAEFSNGLKYPRESGGAPEEVINCRCTDITFADEDSEQVAQAMSSQEESTQDEEE